MKVQLKNLLPNPFRKMKQYPIDRQKVESLKNSITETTFWDNILARKKGKKFEIAYGHHRLIALQELGIKEIDIPVRVLSDASMLQIMANENLEWNTTPAVVCETIAAVKEFLDAQIAPYAHLEAFCKAAKFSGLELFPHERNFQQIKKAGVGRETICKFLGKNWKKWMIEQALALLKDKTIDREAIKTIPTIGQAQQFRISVKNYHISKPKQRKLAEQIRKEGIGQREIPKIIRSSIEKKPHEDPVLAKLEETFEAIGRYATTLEHKISSFKTQLKEHDVAQIEGDTVSITLVSLLELREAIDRLLEINQTKQIEGNTR